MIILPAIDIKDGNCVRLFKGDFSTVEKVAADYMETAKGFEAAGASWIQIGKSTRLNSSHRLESRMPSSA